MILADYVDASGLLHDTPSKSSGNALGFSCLYSIAEADRGRQEGLSFFLRAKQAVEHVPGVYSRNSGDGGEQQSPDDLVCMASALLYFKQPISAATWLKAAGPFFYYNTEAPGTVRHRDGRLNTHAWMGKNAGLVAMVRMAAGVDNPLDHLSIAASLFISAGKEKGNQDNWMQSWAMVRALEKNGAPLLVQAAIKTWREEAPPIGEVAYSYFGDKSMPLIDSLSYCR